LDLIWPKLIKKKHSGLTEVRLKWNLWWNRLFELALELMIKIAVKNSLSIGVARLGLADQDYYSSEEKIQRKRDKYEQHIARMLQLIGETQIKPQSMAKT
jgi:predicted metalloendopeptidase